MTPTRCRHDYSDGDICSRCDAVRPLRNEHGLRCLCRACCDARRDEVAARREELAGRRAAFFEGTVKLAKARRPQPGTLQAIAKRYGRSA